MLNGAHGWASLLQSDVRGREGDGVIVVFTIVLVVHGLIHLLGFAKAFGLAELPQLTQPIAPCLGALWLVAALLFVAAAAALLMWPRWWWVIGAGAIVVSMFVIVAAWPNAKFGALGNLIALIGVVFGFLAQGPFSLRAAYERDIDHALARFPPVQMIRDADLAHLPAPVQRYLRGAGVVGQPRVNDFYVRMHGRIRSGRDAQWMALTAEQYNFVDEPARLFYLNASMFGIPVQGYHRYVGPSATMTVKAAALVPVIEASGPEMDQGETVTMFNDMCVMAPATLIDPAIGWEAVDDRTARARFTNAGHTIRAELSFNGAGELTNFWSDDRYQTSPDGKSVRKVRWSTPMADYRAFGPVRLSSGGEARWHDASGDYAYIELTLDDVKFNVHSREDAERSVSPPTAKQIDARRHEEPRPS
jgi:hypothetical protein